METHAPELLAVLIYVFCGLAFSRGLDETVKELYGGWDKHWRMLVWCVALWPLWAAVYAVLFKVTRDKINRGDRPDE